MGRRMRIRTTTKVMNLMDTEVFENGRGRPVTSVASYKNFFVILFLVVAVVLFLAGCGSEADKVPVTGGANPPQNFVDGERLFNKNCAECHGMEGRGTAKGPPLVHKIYEPGHHADASFYFAVQSGVRAHHWGFGDMPRVSGVGEKEVAEIIAYVRWLQRKAGIY